MRKRKENHIRERLSASTGGSNLGGDLMRPHAHTKQSTVGHSHQLLQQPISIFSLTHSVTLSCGTAGRDYRRNRSSNCLIIQLYIHLPPRKPKTFLRAKKDVVGWKLILKYCLAPTYRNLIHIWNIKLSAEVHWWML